MSLETLPGKEMTILDIRVGDLFVPTSPSGTILFFIETEFNSEFNPDGVDVKYVYYIFMNGPKAGTRHWREEADMIQYIEDGSYEHIRVKK